MPVFEVAVFLRLLSGVNIASMLYFGSTKCHFSCCVSQKRAAEKIIFLYQCVV